MGASRLDHTGFTVSDLDRSVAFYRDLLGCEVLATQEKQGGYLAAIVGYPDAHVRMAHLRVPGSAHVIELFQYLAPPGGKAEVEPRNVGSSHLSFIVDDLAALYDSLVARGVTSFVSPPVEVDTGINRGGRALYLRDPDGITVELFQPPSAAATIESDSPR
jgi:lactoylglutathione lyase